MSSISKQDKSKLQYDLNLKLLNIDWSENSTNSKSEEVKKYSKDSQDYKDKSTNLPSTVEATPAKHSEIEPKFKTESSEKNKFKKIRIFK